MREKRNARTSLFDPQAVDRPVADELERASAWLDAQPELLDEIAADLGARSGWARGRRGLSCETVLRCDLGADELVRGDLVDQVDQVQALHPVAVALVDRVDADVARVFVHAVRLAR